MSPVKLSSGKILCMQDACGLRLECSVLDAFPFSFIVISFHLGRGKMAGGSLKNKPCI